MRKTVDILGIKIDTFTAVQALEYIVQLADDGRGHYVVTPNPEFIMQALSNNDFREIVNNADLALPDGVGILWAAKYLSMPLSSCRWLATPQAYWRWLWLGACIIFNPKLLTDVIPERITGADMVWELSKLAAERGWGVFLLGAAPGVAKEASEHLEWLYPNLVIAGAMAGPPYDNEAEVVKQINDSKPKFVFLAFPASEQLRWMKDYKQQFPGTIMMGIGGALDFITGGVALNAPTGSAQKARRAPEWLQNRGLEWVWRYLTQPWRRNRIKIAVPGFMRRVVLFKLNSSPH
ncbi:MAG: WecB/TagA/CpsF family glycosyltransferase [Patescibacteria group bacterium]